MNPKHVHTPPPPASTRVRCPVCHQEVYSRAGIHPQCAVRQSDPPKPKNKSKESPGQVDQPVADAVIEPTTSGSITLPDPLAV
jgi:hypothetical protein